MSIKLDSIVRSAALLGAMSVALVATGAMAQAPRPDFPGAKQGETMQPDIAKSPRPDFPGAKQSDNPDAAKSPRPDFPGPKQSDGSSQK
jgi:hypothetical protein